MMKKIIVLTTLVMTGCTTVKDTNGKDAGTCIGLPCLLRAAVGHPMVVEAPQAASAPAATTTQADQPVAKAQ